MVRLLTVTTVPKEQMSHVVTFLSKMGSVSSGGFGHFISVILKCVNVQMHEGPRDECLNGHAFYHCCHFKCMKMKGKPSTQTVLHALLMFPRII